MAENEKKELKHDSYDSKFKGGSPSCTGSALSGALLAKFYLDSSIARRIVDVVPEEIVTSGFGLDGVKDEKAFKSLWDGMKLNEKLISAFAWSRLFGGSAVVGVINDGRALTSPAKPGAKLESLRVYERDQVSISKRETSARSARYGDPVTYKISPGGGVGDYEVHYSRLYIIDGERVPESVRKLNGGWGASVLNQETIEAIRDYEQCEDLATELLRRKQQAVWGAKNLAELCDDNDGMYAARLRLAQVDDHSGVGRAIGIDAEDETYTVLNSDITGVPEFLDKKFDRIVTCSGIHEIILKNKNVGGVSASQNTALETFYKLISRKRNEDYRPLLEWLIPLIITEEEWSIRFDPLSQPSAKEEAETFNKNVDSVTKLVEHQLIDADEGRKTIEAMTTYLKLKAGGAPEADPNDGDPEAERTGDDA